MKMAVILFLHSIHGVVCCNKKNYEYYCYMYNKSSVINNSETIYFFTGYTPAELPVSCLTMAPRFDFIASNESSYLRKPLVEVNSE